MKLYMTFDDDLDLTIDDPQEKRGLLYGENNGTICVWGKEDMKFLFRNTMADAWICEHPPAFVAEVSILIPKIAYKDFMNMIVKYKDVFTRDEIYNLDYYPEIKDFIQKYVEIQLL